MTCKRFQRDLPDWVTGRLDPQRQGEMEAHRAQCVTCSQQECEERALDVAWQNLPTPPTPNLLPRLEGRLQALRPTPHPRWDIYFTATGMACAVLAVIWLSVGGSRQITHRPTEVVTTPPQSTPPLDEMLEDVRWRSSDQWEARREPPPYNEEMRQLLVQEGH